MTSELTLTEKNDGVGIITLNRPAKLNAMNNALIQEIHTALNEFEEADDVKVVIMTGAGERAFCAGADIHEEAAMSKEKSSLRRTSTTCPPQTSVLKGYIPKVGGQLITLSPGSMNRRKIKSISSSEPAPPRRYSLPRPVYSDSAWRSSRCSGSG